MIYNARSDELIKTELEYVREYVGRVFGKELEKEFFAEHINDLIKQKINDYLYQRYRDWTAPELARLRDQWDKPEQLAQPVTSEVSEPKRRGRPLKENQKSRV